MTSRLMRILNIFIEKKEGNFMTNKSIFEKIIMAQESMHKNKNINSETKHINQT